MHAAELDKPGSRHAGDSHFLKLAIALSLVLHLGLAVLLVMRAKTGSVAAVNPEQIRINFVPVNPQRSQPLDAPSAPVAEDNAVLEASPESVETASTESSALADSEPVSRDAVAPATSEAVSNPEQDPIVSQAVVPESVPVPPTITAPNAVAIQQSVNSVRQSDGVRFYQYDCDERQERSDLLDCGEQTTTGNFAEATRNATYEALNPVRTRTRSQRTVSTVASNADELAAQLRASGVSGDLEQYLLNEMQVGISENSKSRFSGPALIERMTDRSDAAEQARRVLGDGWVEQQTEVIRERRVAIDR